MEGRSLHSLRSVEKTERNPVEKIDRNLVRVTGKGSLVIPRLAPFVIPGQTGNLPDGRVVMGPSDIKMAKNMMDGPGFGCFAAVFGTVRQEIAPKVVGRCLEAMRSDSQSVMSDWSEEMGVYFGSTRQRPICDSLRWRTL